MHTRSIELSRTHITSTCSARCVDVFASTRESACLIGNCTAFLGVVRGLCTFHLSAVHNNCAADRNHGCMRMVAVAQCLNMMSLPTNLQCSRKVKMEETEKKSRNSKREWRKVYVPLVCIM